MRFISDTEINRTRKIVVGKMRSETKKWARVFVNKRDYESWLTSATNEGIAIALDADDKWEHAKGDFAYWCYLKTRKAAYRDLEREKKHAELISILKREPALTSQDPFAKNLLLGAKLDGIVKELTRDQKQALAYIYLVGYSPEETAIILKRQRNAVDALVHRAKKKAREVYQRNTTSQSPIENDRQDSVRSHRPRSSLSTEPEEPIRFSEQN